MVAVCRKSTDESIEATLVCETLKVAFAASTHDDVACDCYSNAATVFIGT